jgi:hypothetical protein
MTVQFAAKPTFEEFIQTCTPLYIAEKLEQDMQDRISELMQSVANSAPNGASVEDLSRFLRKGADHLGVILALANISQEKFLRLFSAIRFAQHDYGTEWTINTMSKLLREDEEFAEQVAQLLLNGRDDPLLKHYIAPFHLDRLALPQNWFELLRDPHMMRNIVRRKLEGEYSNKKGRAVEDLVRAELNRLKDRYGLDFKKGRVELVGKEVDHVVPSFTDPYVLIMTSYMETTSSSQTARANEQNTMYAKLKASDRSRVFINFVDGAGWLARRSDLEKLYNDCDYIINIRTLERLEEILCRHVPDRFFTKRPKPQIEE